ncbi:DUF669 domain-containing protein [Mesomycoplasma molare]|uniref:DUF669 domain-containing protein n=1 Tax=Mesomycoplasma molare TaxID=171288 RepID=A0ABY5TTQ3_9BACT|nr:DUF669 domain-containing protein [Mesomycoplasma molare]UWD34038.1 DUF669 domain-containing protein [Mesomycoplasma molare]
MFTFNKDWEQRAKELDEKYKKIPDGEYKGIVKSASLTRSQAGYEVVDIMVEITDNQELSGATTNKLYYIDNNYPHKKKLDLDGKLLDKLLLSFNLKYASKEEFVIALLKLSEKPVSIKIKRTTGADGKTYITRYIEPLTEAEAKDGNDENWDMNSFI